jgi:hypothetical protein
MIKVVSTYLAADTGRIERGRRAKSGGLCNESFGSYPLLDNASSLSSVVIGGMEWAQDAGHRACRSVLLKGADSAVENGQDKTLLGSCGSLSLIGTDPGCRCFAANCILRSTTSTPLVHSRKVAGCLQDAYGFASLPSHRLTKNTWNSTSLPMSPFEDQLLSISVFPNVWQTRVNRFIDLIGPLISFWVKTQLKSQGRHELHLI